MRILRLLTVELFLMPGVDRPFMKSLWSANTRWAAVTEDGLDGDRDNAFVAQDHAASSDILT